MPADIEEKYFLKEQVWDALPHLHDLVLSQVDEPCGGCEFCCVPVCWEVHACHEMSITVCPAVSIRLLYC